VTPDFAVSGWRSLHTLVCNATCSSADGVPIDTFVKLLLLSELGHLTTLPMPLSGQHDRLSAPQRSINWSDPISLEVKLRRYGL